MNEKTVKNTGHLCSVFCPECGRVTNKISFNLLREAKKAEVSCPDCGSITVIEYDGKKARVWQVNEEGTKMAKDIKNQVKKGNVKNGVITKKN